MRNIFIVIVGLVLSSSALAQPKKVKMGFTAPDEESQDIQSTIRAKLILTDRYTVTDLKAADVVTDVECMKFKDDYYFCAISVYLAPDSHEFMAMNAPALIRGQAKYIADKAFEGIVATTTDEKVENAWIAYFSGVEETCQAAPKACATTTSMVQ